MATAVLLAFATFARSATAATADNGAVPGHALARSQPPVFVVTDFGAKGDNHTDCTAAFQDALDAAKQAGGGETYVPPGIFILAGNLTVWPGVVRFLLSFECVSTVFRLMLVYVLTQTLRGSYSSVPSHSLGIGAVSFIYK